MAAVRFREHIRTRLKLTGDGHDGDRHYGNELPDEYLHFRAVLGQAKPGHANASRIFRRNGSAHEVGDRFNEGPALSAD